jgi:hypothetical protein
VRLFHRWRLRQSPMHKPCNSTSPPPSSEAHASWDNAAPRVPRTALRRICRSEGSALATPTRANGHVLAARSAVAAVLTYYTLAVKKLPTM